MTDLVTVRRRQLVSLLKSLFVADGLDSGRAFGCARTSANQMAVPPATASSEDVPRPATEAAGHLLIAAAIAWAKVHGEASKPAAHPAELWSALGEMAERGWGVYLEEDAIHVIPVRDQKEHSMTDDCWCAPTIELGVVIHHSADKREKMEVQ
jgi:hypothetical protein